MCTGSNPPLTITIFGGFLEDDFLFIYFNKNRKVETTRIFLYSGEPGSLSEMSKTPWLPRDTLPKVEPDSLANWLAVSRAFFIASASISGLTLLISEN